MLALRLPYDPSGNTAKSNHERRNDVCLTPLLLDSSREREWHKDKCKDGDEQNNADDVQLPEKRDGEVLGTVALERRLVGIEGTGALSTAGDDEESEEEGNCADYS